MYMSSGRFGKEPSGGSLGLLEKMDAELRLQNGDLPDTPAIYVLGTQSPSGIFHQIAERMKTLRGWKVVEIDSGHDVVLDATDALVQLLNEIARQ